MNRNQLFWLSFTPIFFVCAWITIGIVYACLNPDKSPRADDVYRDACLHNGGIPNTGPAANEWRCEKL